MKSFTLVLPFLAIREPEISLREIRAASPAIPPKPPQPPEEPDEPRREYPFWTCFIDNPRPKS